MMILASINKNNLSPGSLIFYCSFYLEAQDLLNVFLLAALFLPRLQTLRPDVLSHLQDFFTQLILGGNFLHKKEQLSPHGRVAGQHLEDGLRVRQALLAVLHVLQAPGVPAADPFNKHLEDGLGGLREKQLLVLLVRAALRVGGALLAVLGLLPLMLIVFPED